MNERTTKVMLLVLGGLAFCTLVVAQPVYFKRWIISGEGLAVGMQFGSFFGLVALAAAWMAAGSPRPLVRIGQSLVLCALAVMGTLLGLLIAGMPQSQLAALAGVLGVVAIGQWLLMVCLFWPLMAMRSIRLRHIQDLPTDPRATKQQFAIREVLIVTALAAVFLGVIRWWVFSQQWEAERPTSRPLFFFGYLTLCNILVCAPLLIAPLLRRHATVSTLVALAFVAVVTVYEIEGWFHQIGPTPWMYVPNHRRMFWSLNLFQAMWILLALGILRAGGYRLAAAAAQRGRQGEASAEAAR